MVGTKVNYFLVQEFAAQHGGGPERQREPDGDLDRLALLRSKRRGRLCGASPFFLTTCFNLFMPNTDPDKYRTYMREYMINRYRRRRRDLVKQLGGKCRDCGTKKRLEFHHTEKKDFWVGERLHTISEVRLQEEIKKCVLLCRQCHIDITMRERGFNRRTDHGTEACYHRGKMSM